MGGTMAPTEKALSGDATSRQGSGLYLGDFPIGQNSRHPPRSCGSFSSDLRKPAGVAPGPLQLSGPFLNIVSLMPVRLVEDQ